MSSHSTTGISGAGVPSSTPTTFHTESHRETYSPPIQRLYGIDAARAIAVAGMVMVHFGPTPVPDTVLEWFYGLSHGRASVLFVLLAGVGVALLAGRHPGERHGERPAGRFFAMIRVQIVIRGVLLLPIGLCLQRLDHGVLVILQYYALYFVFAALVLTVPDRWLIVGAIAALAGGPLIYLAVGQVSPEWYTEAPAILGDTSGKLARDLMLTGAYPLVTWAAPLLFGMWIGRRDLASPAAQWRLFAGGLAVAVVTALCAALASVGPISYALLSNEPHSQMPLWMMGAIGSACAVLGGMLLVAERLSRLIWPLVATGQMALSVYVGHLFLIDAAAAWILSEEVARAVFIIGVFMMVVTACCTLWRIVFSRGPLEAALKAPGLTAGRVARRLGLGKAQH